MQNEIEAKFLAADHDAIRKKLAEVGAVLEQPKRLMRRVNLDLADGSLHKKGGWVRLRDEGHKIALTYKQLNSWDVHGVQEIETTVGSYDAALNFLQAVGLEIKSYQETTREAWKLGDVEIVLDEWPWVKPFIEIEGPSEAHITDVAEQLGFEWHQAVFGSVEPVYVAEFDIAIEDFYKLDTMTFDIEPPEWLAEKRR